MTVAQRKFDFWVWIRDKVMPSLIIALCVGVFATYVQIIRLVDSHEIMRSELTSIKAEVANIKESYVKRIELIELQKQMSQQLEIIILKSKR